MVGSIYSAAMNEAQREKVSTFIQERNIKNDREDHITEKTPNQIRKRTTQIITSALNILNNPYTINRKTTFFSPITYINRLSDKLSNNDLEPAIARSR